MRSSIQGAAFSEGMSDEESAPRAGEKDGTVLGSCNSITGLLQILSKKRL